MATIKCSEPVATTAWNWRDGWQKPRLGWGGRMCELTRRSHSRYLPLVAIPGLLIKRQLVGQPQVPDMEALLDWLQDIRVMEKS